jgi:hypothetical protein
MNPREIQLDLSCTPGPALAEFATELRARLGRRGLRVELSSCPPPPCGEAVLLVEDTSERSARAGVGCGVVKLTVRGRSGPPRPVGAGSWSSVTGEVAPTGECADLSMPEASDASGATCRIEVGSPAQGVDRAVAVLQDLGLLPRLAPGEQRDEAILYQRLRELGYL